MKKIKVGLLKETKIPLDRRSALTPRTATELLTKFSNVELFVQPSDLRAFKDEEYTQKGLTLKENLEECDVLIGVKEVKIEKLIPEKTYLFFSHVAKKQPYNKPLLKAVLDKKITLIDYEYLTNKKGMRLVAFGKWAGVVGAYNGMRAYGLRTGNFNIKPAHEYHDKNEMYSHCKDVKINPIKIVITGGGRVATGATETLKAFDIKEVSPNDFLNNKYNEAVFTKVEPPDYVKHKESNDFDYPHFFANPQEYETTFDPFTKVADVYVACHFWDPKSPEFITDEQAKHNDFSIKVIADVSCDIKKPIASTLRASTIAEPFYDYNPETGEEEKAFSNEKNISVMAIDNLPGELPRDASEDFSQGLLDNIFPFLFGEDSEKVIERATIAKNGHLTDKYNYLSDWVNS